MRIGIDIRSLVEGKQSGVEEYVINLLTNIFELDTKNEYRLFCNAYKSKSLDISIFKNYKNVKIYKFNWPNKILNLSFRLFNYPKINKMLGGVDIFFAPNIMFFGISKKCKLVLTIHDLSFEYYKRFLSPWRRFWHWFLGPKKLAQRADKIICPSYSTKNDLIKTYKIPAEKIEVVYSGLNNDFKKLEAISYKLKAMYGLPEKFILFLGTFEPRKNIIGIISAYEKLKVEYNVPHKLVLAGGSGWQNKSVFEAITKSNVKNDIILTGAIDQKDKCAIYNLTSLFIYPSFYEGFGFPPLEAMACGVPVITSSCSSLAEVAGDGALMVNPYNVEEIAAAMQHVLFDEKLQGNLVRKGYEQTKKFGWEEAANETLEMFRCLVKSLR